MNRERLLALAERIGAAPPERFSMWSWISVPGSPDVDFLDEYGVLDEALLCRSPLREPPCGTAACVGGWALMMMPPEERPSELTSIQRVVGDWLGLDGDQRSALFLDMYRERPCTGFDLITARVAAACIRRGVETGDFYHDPADDPSAAVDGPTSREVAS